MGDSKVVITKIYRVHQFLFGLIKEVIVPIDFEDVIIVRGSQEDGVACGEVLKPGNVGFIDGDGNVDALWLGEIIDRDSVGIDSCAGPILNAATAEISVDLPISAVPDATGVIDINASGIDSPIIPESELGWLEIAVAIAVAPPPANTFVGVGDGLG